MRRALWFLLMPLFAAFACTPAPTDGARATEHAGEKTRARLNFSSLDALPQTFEEAVSKGYQPLDSSKYDPLAPGYIRKNVSEDLWPVGRCAKDCEICGRGPCLRGPNDKPTGWRIVQYWICDYSDKDGGFDAARAATIEKYRKNLGIDVSGEARDILIREVEPNICICTCVNGQTYLPHECSSP